MFQSLLKTVSAALVTGIVTAYAFAKLLAGGAAISSAAKPTLILYPLFVMFLLVAAVVTRMRMAAHRRRAPRNRRCRVLQDVRPRPGARGVPGRHPAFH